MRPTPEQREHYLQLAAELMTRLDEPPHHDLILRLLSSVLRMSADARRADLKLAAAALEELEHAFDVLELFAENRKVAIFGSARCAPDTAIYQQARDFAAAIAARDFMVITGAGPGVMAAGNEGAGRDRSFGMNISLPFEAAANPWIAGDLKLLDFRYFFTRKLAFIKDSHAVVVCPGGLGTMDEGFEALTLIQTGKAQLMPVVCLHPPGSGFWDEWDHYLRVTLLNHHMISEADRSLYKVTDSVTEACEEIVRFYRRYHSMRYLGDELVMRLSGPVSADELAELNEKFRDILRSGAIEPCEAPKETDYDQKMQALHHLKFRFKWGCNGRLRQMIDHLNALPGPTSDFPPERGEGGRLPVETDEK